MESLGKNWFRMSGAPESMLQELVSKCPEIPQELIELLRYSNGGEGDVALPVGNFVLDSVEEILRSIDAEFEREQFPGLVFFGGDGGGERLAFHSADLWKVVAVDPIAGMESMSEVAESFEAFMRHVGQIE